MAGDHLTQRQLNSGYTVIHQHPLTDTSTGVYQRTTMPHNGATTWADREAKSHYLPRSGRRGTWMDNEQITLSNPSVSAQDITVEIVLTARSGENYNFFGSVWWREAVSLFGNSGYKINIVHIPVNDVIGDTSGRFAFDCSDGSGTRIASRTVHSRPVITDYLPHHVCVTHAGTGTANVVKIYVDGVNTETYTLTTAMSGLNANGVRLSVQDYFTCHIGAYSNFCLTQGILSASEIKARALLVNGTSGKVLTDVGTMAWSAADSAWIPLTKGYSSSNIYLPKDGQIAIGGDYTEEKYISGQMYRLHYFKTVGTSNFIMKKSSQSCDVLLVGGGGSGGGNGGGGDGLYHGGGGGGGLVVTANPTVSSGIYEIVVGAGGTSLTVNGNHGGTSSGLSYTATGGTTGHTSGIPPTRAAPGGGSGNSAFGGGSSNSYAGGGASAYGSAGGGGGSGGTGAAGAAFAPYNGGSGGIGYSSSITGTSISYGGGGGGGTSATNGIGGSGSGGGGNGGSGLTESVRPTPGVNGLGGGGGGNGVYGAPEGAAGGSGIVIIRYAI